MKIKNILLIASLSLTLFATCFAEDIKIDNPYANVGVLYKKQYHSKRSNISTKEFYTGNQLFSSNQADKVEIQVVLFKGTQDEIKLASHKYDAQAKNRSEGQQYNESFSIGKAKGKITYTTRVKYGTRGKGNHPIIKSVEIKILKLSFEEEFAIWPEGNCFVNEYGERTDCLLVEGPIRTEERGNFNCLIAEQEGITSCVSKVGKRRW